MTMICCTNFKNKTNYKDDSIKNILDAKKATRGITTESVYSEYPIA